MRTLGWTILLSGLILVAGCASKAPLTNDTEIEEDFVSDAVDGQTDDSLLETVASTGDPGVAVPAIADSDSDGIVDSVDNCADTASGVMVDEAGCEIVMGPIEGLKFASNDSKLNADGKQALEIYISALKRYPEVVVSVEGHTDNRGSAAENLELSKRRVITVIEYLAENGINPARVKPYGFGESRPRAANATASGREQNRRIEIKVIEGLL